MIFRLILVLSILMFLVVVCQILSMIISLKTRFDDGLSFFEEAKYVKASQQFNIIVEEHHIPT